MEHLASFLHPHGPHASPSIEDPLGGRTLGGGRGGGARLDAVPAGFGCVQATHGPAAGVLGQVTAIWDYLDVF